MKNEYSGTSFAPGDHVFLQGEVIPSFFKVTSGRFAKVYSKKSALEIGIKRMLNEADLIGIVSHQELFGEIEALLGQPQGFSVFALDESTAVPVAADNHGDLPGVLSSDPIIGVKACVSFARYIKQFFWHFAIIAKEEVELDAFIRATARDYLAGVNELEGIVGTASQDLDLIAAKANMAYATSQGILKQVEMNSVYDYSVACGVVSHISRDSKIQTFKAGSLLCKEGTIGDRLFIVTEGRAEVVIGGGKSNIVIDHYGSVVGEIAVLLNLYAKVPDARRVADVTCVTDLTAIVVPLDQVEEFFIKKPEIMTKMLMAMVTRSERTSSLCESTEKRLKSMLYDKLGILLEGLNFTAQCLSKRQDKQSLVRTAAFFSQRARAVYNRFKDSLNIIAGKTSIKT